MLNSHQPRWLLLAFALLAVASWTVAAVMITRGQHASTASFQTQITYTTAKRRLGITTEPVVLHDVSYDSPSGAVTIHWYDSDFEPNNPRAYAVVSLYVDSVRVASTIKGSLAGTYEDGQGDLAWYGSLSPGRHKIVVQLEHAVGSWGAPYTDPGYIGTDELIVQSDGDRAG